MTKKHGNQKISPIQGRPFIPKEVLELDIAEEEWGDPIEHKQDPDEDLEVGSHLTMEILDEDIEEPLD